jgi:hypothetical protein
LVTFLVAILTGNVDAHVLDGYSSCRERTVAATTPDDPALLPPHVRPRRFGGVGKLPLFVLDVPRLDASLHARRDPRNPNRHAFIEPAGVMGLSELQARLCETRDAWQSTNGSMAGDAVGST